jgi:hypothetical protein
VTQNRQKRFIGEHHPSLQLGAPWGPTDRKPFASNLPFTFVNVAMTADGKIAPTSRRFEPFSSKRDRLLMYELRSYADAVISGARTLTGTIAFSGQHIRHAWWAIFRVNKQGGIFRSEMG